MARSRIIWPVTVPPNGVLRTSFGLRPDAWDEDGDGVQFRIGVSDGRTYDELLRQYVNPHGRQADRRWYTVTLDLAAYEGRSVHVIFNTDPGPPGGWNTVHDFACWGEPHIYSAR
jgi:hypothetical protein